MMVFALDARVPVVVGGLDQAGPGDGLLVEGRDFGPGMGHAPGCACCGARTEVGRALAALLHDRARSRVAFFSRVVVVVVTPAGEADLLSALAADPVASACFRKS